MVELNPAETSDSAGRSRAAFPSRLTAIVYADAVASSTAMRDDEITALQSLEHGLKAFLAQMEENGGQLLNYTGDGAVAAFESVAAALTSAIAFQEAASIERPGAVGPPLQFRVAVHLGEIFKESDRFYGDSINVAARIQSVTPPGDVCVSSLVYSAVRSRPDFGFEYLGTKSLKNIAEPVEIYRVFGGGVAAPMLATRRRLAGQPEEKPGAHVLASLERPSIAILPFRNLSPDPDQDFFGDGVADDIITSLTRFRSIDVIARGSSFAFRDSQAAVRDIGIQLKARYVANGSIRRSPGRVRITIELSDALTHRTIWAERYDRPLEDIFAIQDEIAALSVGAISVSIEDAERVQAKTGRPENMDSYGLVLSGQSHALNYTAAENRLARSLYERALEMSPRYGRAHAALSRTHNLDWRYRWTEDRDASRQRALELAVQAIECDSNDARGYAELGYVRLYRKEHDRSLAAYRRALNLNPNDADILAEMGDALAHAGQPEEALAHVERAMRLNPFYPDRYLWAMANAQMKLREFERAIDSIQRMNNPAQGRRILACCYAHLGRLDEARLQAQLIREFDPEFTAEHWATEICPDRLPEHVELFLQGLKAAGL